MNDLAVLCPLKSISVRMIIISAVYLVCGIHVFEVLCGNYLYFSPMPSAYGQRIDLEIKFCSALFCYTEQMEGDYERLQARQCHLGQNVLSSMTLMHNPWVQK